MEDLYNKDRPGYQDTADDNSQLEKTNTRKTRLTLLQINKLRQMNDIRNYEHSEKLTAIQQQYGATPDEEGGERREDLPRRG